MEGGTEGVDVVSNAGLGDQTTTTISGILTTTPEEVPTPTTITATPGTNDLRTQPSSVHQTSETHIQHSTTTCERTQQGDAHHGVSHTIRKTPTVNTPASIPIQIWRGSRRQTSRGEVARISTTGSRNTTKGGGRFARILLPLFHHREKSEKRTSTHQRYETTEQVCKTLPGENPRPPESNQQREEKRLYGGFRREEWILQRPNRQGPPKILPLQLQRKNLSDALFTDGFRQLHGSVPELHGTLYKHSENSVSKYPNIRICGRRSSVLSRNDEKSGSNGTSENSFGDKNYGTTTQSSEITLGTNKKGRIFRIRAQLQRFNYYCTHQEVEGRKETSISNAAQRKDRKIKTAASGNDNWPGYGTVTCMPRRQIALTQFIYAADQNSEENGMARRHNCTSHDSHESRTVMVGNIFKRTTFPPIGCFFQMRRIGDYSYRCFRPLNRGSVIEPPQTSAFLSSPIAQVTTGTHKYEGAQSGVGSHSAVRTACEGNVVERAIGQYGRHSCFEQVGHQTTTTYPSSGQNIPLVPENAHQIDGHICFNTRKRLCGQAFTIEKGDKDRRGGSETVQEVYSSGKKKRSSLENIKRRHATLTQDNENKTSNEPNTHGHIQLRGDTSLVHPITHESKEGKKSRYPVFPGPQQSGQSTTDNSANAPISYIDSATLGPSTMVLPDSPHGGVETSHLASKLNSACESKISLAAYLEMDFGESIRAKEKENNIPQAARLQDRISSRTETLYNKAWKQLRTIVQQDTALLKRVHAPGSQSEILTGILAAYADSISSKGLSLATYQSAQSAVSHFLQASKPTVQSLLQATNKNYKRKHPAGPRNDSLPDIHRMFDIALELAKDQTQKGTRQHLIILLLLLSSRRMSDIARIWRDERSMVFTVIQLDAPRWAAKNEGKAARILQELKLLPKRKLKPNEFVAFKFRSYMGKTCAINGKRFSSWLQLTENREDDRLCPVLAVAKYLKATQKFSIEHSLKYDSNCIISSITDNQGKNPRSAAPLLVSLNGSPRKGLQSSTISGLVRRVITIPLKMEFTPHILRACSSSYKRAYGVSEGVVKAVGEWSNEATFNKFYFRVVNTPVHPSRLVGVQMHDWVLAHAHTLARSVNSSPSRRKVSSLTRLGSS